MRPISGFERPAFQWLFVALSVTLILVTAGATWFGRRAMVAGAAAQTVAEGGRLERQHLEAQLARERSAREALALELERQRAGSDVAETGRVLPTLTLTPVTSRGPSPPAPTVVPQYATQVVELRLVFPAGAKPFARFEIVWRDWSSGTLVWSRGGLVPASVDGRPGVTAYVTGDVLRSGAYEIQLSGWTLDGRKEDAAAYEVAVK
jgi:hypothetical protein